MRPMQRLVHWFTAKEGVRLVVLAATIVSATASTISYKTHNILDYNDATAHLDTARRVVDSLTPGIVQVGSVWLPLLHLLLVPFVSVHWLWQSGVAGSIVSGASFVVLCTFFYKVMLLVTGHRKAVAAIAVGILLTSPNLLYLQTTAMFEPLLLAMTTCAVYYLVKWSQTHELNDLIGAAAFTMLATLTRYDGWAFFVAASALLFVQGMLMRRRNQEGMILLFVILGGFGIFLWLLYNGMIFHDPLYFQDGPYSAAAQQAILAAQHSLPTQHDLALSARVYGTAVLYNIGLILPVVAVLGAVWYAKDTWRTPDKWFPWLLAIPLPFNILSLYTGQSVLWLPSLPPYFNSYFNARYGILMLLAVVFFSAYLASRRRWLVPVVGLLIILQVVSFMTYFPHLAKQPRGLVTLHDSVSTVNGVTIETAQYLHDHYRGGLILASSASMDSFIFHANLPLKDFITEGNGYYWNTSLRYPEKYASWAVTFTDYTDAIGRVFTQPGPKTHFKIVYQNQTYTVWHKDS
jgi:hypothetical protein